MNDEIAFSYGEKWLITSYTELNSQETLKLQTSLHPSLWGRPWKAKQSIAIYDFAEVESLPTGASMSNVLPTKFLESGPVQEVDFMNSDITR